MSTIAMQRASPMTMRPVRNSGWSARKVHASTNMSSGPITQLSSSESQSSRRSPVTWPMSS